MTALDMIREGFSIWVGGMLGENMYTTPIVFTLLFLFGFLATAILRTFSMPRAAVADMPSSLCDEGREIINDANTARLFELETEVAASKASLKRFTETLSTTFAHLSGGLAIFDADKSLYLFNPALCDLLDLDPVWLAKRPSIADFISKLREKRHLPEAKNFLEWRRLLTDLKDTGQNKSYDDEWVLPDGRVFRVTGQPHPRGAVAFLFEDISAQVFIERQRRLEVSLNQSILNGLSDAVAVISSSGQVKFTNTALSNMFGVAFCERFVRCGVSEIPESKSLTTWAADFWPKLVTYVAASKRNPRWEQSLVVQDGPKVLANVSALSDGSTLVAFKINTKISGVDLPVISGVPDPLHFAKLEGLLRQREISFTHSGFDLDCVDQEGTAKMRHILWYLTISAANHCRKGGEIALSSRSSGQYTALKCHISDADHVDGAQEDVAASLLRSLTSQPDGRNSWAYDAKVDPYTVLFKAQKRLKLTAL